MGGMPACFSAGWVVAEISPVEGRGSRSCGTKKGWAWHAGISHSKGIGCGRKRGWHGPQ